MILCAGAAVLESPYSEFTVEIADKVNMYEQRKAQTCQTVGGVQIRLIQVVLHYQCNSSAVQCITRAWGLDREQPLRPTPRGPHTPPLWIRACLSTPSSSNPPPQKTRNWEWHSGGQINFPRPARRSRLGPTGSPTGERQLTQIITEFILVDGRRILPFLGMERGWKRGGGG